MAYSLRLPDALDAAARARADYLGISLNALVCVALDAWLRSPGQPGEPPAATPGNTSGDGAGNPSPSQTSLRKAEPASARPAAAAPLTRAERQEFTRQQRIARKGQR